MALLNQWLNGSITFGSFDLPKPFTKSLNLYSLSASGSNGLTPESSESGALHNLLFRLPFFHSLSIKSECRESSYYDAQCDICLFADTSHPSECQMVLT